MVVTVKIKTKKIDYPLLVTFMILVVIGLLMVYSASNVVASYKYDDAFYFFNHSCLH